MNDKHSEWRMRFRKFLTHHLLRLSRTVRWVDCPHCRKERERALLDLLLSDRCHECGQPILDSKGGCKPMFDLWGFYHELLGATDDDDAKRIEAEWQEKFRRVVDAQTKRDQQRITRLEGVVQFTLRRCEDNGFPNGDLARKCREALYDEVEIRQGSNSCDVD